MNGQVRLVLASASPRRLELLRQVGLKPEVVPSGIEETVTSTHPDQVVRELALQKARDVAARLTCRADRAVVLGADTVVAVDGQMLGKPGTSERAVQMLEKLQGRSHQVYTGVAMIFLATGEEKVFAEETVVHILPMSAAQIAAYVKSKEPLDKAGAYGIQGRFAAYVSGISGDYSNVVGLPLCRVCQELMRHGVWPDSEE